MVNYDPRPPASDSLAPATRPPEPATVRDTVTEAGGDVVQTAKEQVREVVAETGHQAQQLYAQFRSEVDTQARAQQQRAASGLLAVADEAARIAERGGESGVATQFNRQAAERVREAGRWLEQREPRQVLNEIKIYARRHPGTFLAGAALLGIVAGRLTRNLAQGDGATMAGPTGVPVRAPVTRVGPATTVDTIAGNGQFTATGVTGRSEGMRP